MQEWFSESEASNGFTSCPLSSVSSSLDRLDLSSNDNQSSSSFVASDDKSQVMTSDSFEGQEQKDEPKDKVRAHDDPLQRLIHLDDDEKDADTDVHVLVSDCGTTLKLKFMDKKSGTMLDDEVRT